MIKKFLDLGMQPLANRYLTKKDIIKKNKEQFYHLEVGFNSKTKLVSIINTVPSKKMFDSNYPYKSSMSQTMILSFKKLAKNLIKTYNPNSILEIGSNDGPLIRNFSKKKVICVEPCKNLAKITKKISRFLASFQTGYIYHYAFSLIIGIALLLTFILFFV